MTYDSLLMSLRSAFWFTITYLIYIYIYIYTICVCSTRCFWGIPPTWMRCGTTYDAFLITTHTTESQQNAVSKVAQLRRLASEPYRTYECVVQWRTTHYLSHSHQDLNKVLWLKSRNSEDWLLRRTNFTRSLALMSIVGTHNTLQHTATHCNTLQHTATHCNTLQRVAPH